jgi:site-specific recombinase XerD
MKSLQHHLTEYVAARRALGTRLEEPAQTLRQFVGFLARKKTRFITIRLALEWSQLSRDVQRATWARKLSMVRQFARWMSVIDPRHQVPPRRLLDVRHRRSKPHIYSDEEITRLMAEAGRLQSTNGMRALTMRTLIGLLAATGWRPGEAAGLERDDVNLGAQLLTIRESKYGKSRLVPIHPSTAAALKCYAVERDRIFRIPSTSFFFVSECGMALKLGEVRRWLCKISRACGLRKKAKDHRCGHGPRLQDLRHTFATSRLVEWYKAGCNVAVQMPKLATYWGHSSVGCTYWYIEAVPELLQLATEFQLGSGQGGQK